MSVRAASRGRGRATSPGEPSAELRAAAAAIYRAAVAAVDPAKLVRERLRRSGDRIDIDAGDRVLRRARPQLWVAAVGKAAAAMIDGLHAVAGGLAGAAIVPRGAALPPALGPAFRIWTGRHPVPDRGTFLATARLLRGLARLPLETTVLFLLSGGASSLLAAPAPGLRRRDEAELGRWLLRSGLPIDAMNAIRKHASAVKGGRLACLAHPRELITLVLSDVPGDDLGTIGSGPTVGDPSTYAEAMTAADRATGRDRFPARVWRHLEAGVLGRRPETPKPGDPRLARARAVLIGANATALAAAAQEARALGYAVRRGPPLTGEARDCATRLSASLPRDPGRPVCVLSGGETTVRLSGRAGRGGRNQELALAASERLPAGWVLLAAGTDGIDGRSPAAGAFADGALRRLARAARADALARHASYDLLASAGCSFLTGPTGTNVGDLVIALHRGR